MSIRTSLIRRTVLWVTIAMGSVAVWSLSVHAGTPDKESGWRELFNGRDLRGWDTWLGPETSGYLDPKSSKEAPIGLNNDPLDVFTIVTKEGVPAIRISGQVFGAITTNDEFDNVHIRVEYKWGQKKWPPRHEPKHYRDSGILYHCVGPHGAGSYAWMRSVECNIMEKGVGQWWSVADTYVDIEGRKVVLENEPWVPYRGEGPGEQCVVYLPGEKQFATSDGITSSLDPEFAGQWNVCEVYAWSNVGIHLLNGEVVLVLMNPRYKKGGREVLLLGGKIQLQSEGAEVFFRKIQARPIDEIPGTFMEHVPASAIDETGFVSLLGDDASGWKQCGPGYFTLKDGVATGHGGMGLWWYSKRTYKNFVLRGDFLQEDESADSGVFLRFPDPGDDPWGAVKRGHEMEIGDADPEKPTWRSGSLYPFQAATAANIRRPGEWNEYEIACIDHNYSVRINGRLITTWTDRKRRSVEGYIGLQNYDDGKTVRHRNLRIKELPDTEAR